MTNDSLSGMSPIEKQVRDLLARNLGHWKKELDLAKLAGGVISVVRQHQAEQVCASGQEAVTLLQKTRDFLSEISDVPNDFKVTYVMRRVNEISAFLAAMGSEYLQNNHSVKVMGESSSTSDEEAPGAEAVQPASSATSSGYPEVTDAANPPTYCYSCGEEVERFNQPREMRLLDRKELYDKIQDGMCRAAKSPSSDSRGSADFIIDAITPYLRPPEPVDMDKHREAFEKHASIGGFELTNLNGIYPDDATQHAWIGYRYALRELKPVSVDHRKIGCLIHDNIDSAQQKHENVIAIYDAIKPYLLRDSSHD